MLRPSLWRKLSFNSSTVLRGVVSHSTDHSVTAYSLTTVSSVCRGLLGTLHAVFWMPIMLHSFIYFVMTCLNNFEFNPLRFFSVSTAYFFFLSLRTSFVMCFAIYIYIRNKLSNNLDGCINHLWKDHPVIYQVIKTEQNMGFSEKSKMGKISFNLAMCDCHRVLTAYNSLSCISTLPNQLYSWMPKFLGMIFYHIILHWSQHGWMKCNFSKSRLKHFSPSDKLQKKQPAKNYY